MKSIICSFLIICFSLSAVAQKAALDNIPLQWSDFKPGNNNFHDAYVSAKIRYEIIPKRISGKTNYIVSSECYIDHAQSIVDKDFNDTASVKVKELALNHERGRLVICFIYHEKIRALLKSRPLKIPLSGSVDDLFSTIMEEMQRTNVAYDRETNYGLNEEQRKWERKLLAQLNALYKVPSDCFASQETVLLPPDDLTKKNDPLAIDYEKAITAFEYDFENNRTDRHAVIAGYPVLVEAPISKFADSNVCISGIDFSKDFEIVVSFIVRKPLSRYDACLVLCWDFTDSIKAGVSIASRTLKVMYFYDEKNKKNYEKEFYFWPRLEIGTHQLALRRIKNDYYFFVNGRFEKKLPCKRFNGRKLSVATAEGYAFVNELKLLYLN